MTQNDERIRRLIAEANRLRYSRRQIFRSGGALGLSSAGIATVLRATGTAAAPRPTRYQLSGKLNILAGSYFVPEAQDFFVKQVTDWGSQNGVDVSCDFINWPDIQARISAAVESGAGPDIIEMREAWQYLYYEQMSDLNDLAMKQGDAAGGYYDWVKNTATVDGNYYSIPVGTSASAFAYRISYFEQAGVADAANNFPNTWEELFAVGKNLKAMGKPLGQALGHSTGDPPNFAYPYMWSYGAMEVEEDGKTVAFNKDTFVEGMNTFIQAWKDAYDETGLSWDDGANNRAFLSDQISGTFNGSSVYIAAQNAKAGASTTDYEVVVDPADISHGNFPEGPAGRFNALNSMSYALMKYSETRTPARPCSITGPRRTSSPPGSKPRRGTSSRRPRATPRTRSTRPIRSSSHTWTWSPTAATRGTRVRPTRRQPRPATSTSSSIPSPRPSRTAMRRARSRKARSPRAGLRPLVASANAERGEVREGSLPR